jgi:hypothetical protein
MVHTEMGNNVNKILEMQVFLVFDYGELTEWLKWYRTCLASALSSNPSTTKKKKKKKTGKKC